MKLRKPSKPWMFGATIAWLLFLFSVPLWLGDLYILHILIVTGIFIIAAMSLNLLLGYTGQLSLGHVAFFGIGAYVSSLVSLGFEVHLLPDWLVTLEPKPAWFGMALGIVFAGACGWVIGNEWKVYAPGGGFTTFTFGDPGDTALAWRLPPT